SDVPYFLTGGTAWMEGHGEILTSLPPLEGFAVGVAVPPFEMSTALVYRRWDEMDGPVGQEFSPRHVPPALRAHGELRNDLTPAACNLRPELGDWMEELSTLWERPVFMSGSGPASFAYFLDHDEAEAAVGEVITRRAATATVPRSWGVSRLGSDSWS
ncbi:MAG: 4-(cytidine 5'-diphospho)-2-C-methyl-D-erythritol kinase, partial [Actinomycetota bacterium]